MRYDIVIYIPTGLSCQEKRDVKEKEMCLSEVCFFFKLMMETIASFYARLLSAAEMMVMYT